MATAAVDLARVRAARATLRRLGRGVDAVLGLTAPAALGVVMLLHLVLFLLIFPNLREDVSLHGTLHLYYLDSGRLLSGSTPYVGFYFEYPPGSLLTLALPRLFAVGYLAYRAAFFVEIALLDAAMLAVLWASARTLGRRPMAVLGLYTLMIVVLGPMVSYRLDLFPAVLTALALLCWLRGKLLWASALLALGAAVKAYPLFLEPALLLDVWSGGGVRRAVRAAAVFGGVLVLGLLPLFLTGAAGVKVLLTAQLARSLQVESVWATVPLLLHRLSRYPLQVVGSDRAEIILGPGNGAGRYGTVVLVGVMLLVYLHWLWARRRGGDRVGVVIGTAALLAAATTLNKVLSPQYFLWWMPAVVLLPVDTRRVRVALGLFVVALGLTQWVYPLHYDDLVRLIKPDIVVVLALRNVLAVAVLVLLMTLPLRPRIKKGAGVHLAPAPTG